MKIKYKVRNIFHILDHQLLVSESQKELGAYETALRSPSDELAKTHTDTKPKKVETKNFC